MELRLAVAVLIGNMRISLDPERMSARTPEHLIAAALSGMTLHFSEGVHVRVSPRAAGARQSSDNVCGPP